MTGCTTTEYWKHNSKPASYFQQDQAYCLNAAINAVPNIAVPTQTTEVRIAQPRSYDTTCTTALGNLNCRTTANTGPVSAFERYQASPQAQMNGAIQQTRATYAETCLVRMGWSKLDPEIVRKEQQNDADQKAIFESAKKQIDIDQRRYVESICKSNKYSEVTRIAPCSTDEIYAWHLSNTDYITKNQKDLYADVSAENTRLNDSLIQFYSKYSNPKFKYLLISAHTNKREQELNNDINLMTMKITWGEYNKINKTISDEYKNKMKAVQENQ